MAKRKISPQPSGSQHETDFGRGEIKDNALKRLLPVSCSKHESLKRKKVKVASAVK